jgi:hypothetical protein
MAPTLVGNGAASARKATALVAATASAAIHTGLTNMASSAVSLRSDAFLQWTMQLVARQSIAKKCSQPRGRRLFI